MTRASNGLRGKRATDPAGVRVALPALRRPVRPPGLSRHASIRAPELI